MVAKWLLPALVLLATGPATAATSPAAAGAESKLQLLRDGRAVPGSVITFSPREINAWILTQLPVYVPRGVRNPRLVLGNGSVTGSALVDFVKLRQGAGETTNWFLTRLLEGEQPVTATAAIRSSGGHAAAYLRRVEVSGVAVSGSALDFLVDNVVRPIFPEVRINEPFPLADGIERIEIAPTAARVVIRPASPRSPASVPSAKPGSRSK